MEIWMQLAEQHVISKTDPRYATLDKAAFASKNLYNAALYEIRQAFFIHESRYISYYQMDSCSRSGVKWRMFASMLWPH
jgi:putative transposase